MTRRIVKTEAVVLKRMDYLDSSRIVTLFSREDGKVSVLAKGARARNNRFGSALEPGAIIQAVYYVKPNRELQTLTQAEVILRTRHLTHSMVRLAAVLHILDLGNAVTDPGHSHPELFDLMCETIQAIDASDDGLAALLLWYRLKLLDLSGVAPGLTACVDCGKHVEPLRSSGSVTFDVGRGGILCQACAGSRREASFLAVPKMLVAWPRLLTLRSLLGGDMKTIRETPMQATEWNELDAVMRLYERNHLLHGRSLKTESMVREFIV